MLFTVMLGIIVGGAAVLLVQQWLRGSLTLDQQPPRLPRTTFPRLSLVDRRRRAA